MSDVLVAWFPSPCAGQKLLTPRQLLWVLTYELGGREEGGKKPERVGQLRGCCCGGGSSDMSKVELWGCS